MNRISIIKSLFVTIAIVSFASCATTHNVMMGDVISFSEEATTSYKITPLGYQSEPFMLHTDKVDYDRKAVIELKKQIKTAPSGMNTSIAYALDLGLDRVKYVRRHWLKNDHIAKYYTFIITDGLDNTSVEVAKNNKQGNYKDLDNYQKQLQKKIKRLMGLSKEQNLYQIYPMLQIGPDLEEFRKEQLGEMTQEEFVEFCQRNYMEKYRGASKGYEKPEAIVAYSFKDIKDRIADLFSSAAFEFYVPKGYNGKRIKMELVNEEGNKASFEGDIVKKGSTYYMKNITFKDGLGVKTSNKKGLELKATNSSDKKAIAAWFRLENLQYRGHSYKVNLEQVKQSYAMKLEGKTYFQPNSEYTKNAKPQIDTYFQFIFDTSGSIGDNVTAEQDVLLEILETITKDLRK
ncbi:MAG: hypothetical protein IKO26_08260 [Paludibacteraceae bacterium]|nr:hypothetical protein [Paludibacteraceae bacterium]